MRVRFAEHALTSQRRFPFLFGGAFIEAITRRLRRGTLRRFPFLFGRAFIEARRRSFASALPMSRFPFLLGRAFIEAIRSRPPAKLRPTFSLLFRKGVH